MAHRVHPCRRVTPNPTARRVGRVRSRAVPAARSAIRPVVRATPLLSPPAQRPPVVEARRHPSRKHRLAATEVTVMRSSSGISRSTLLKRAGIGAAVVGAGAMVTASTASAQGSVACIHAGGCGGCGAPSCSECCGCWVTTEGCCICGESSVCDPHRNCHTSNDCPPGYACVVTCCGQVCVPPCGTCDHFTECCNQGAAHIAGRPTDMGAGAAGHGGGHEEEPAQAPGHGHG